MAFDQKPKVRSARRSALAAGNLLNTARDTFDVVLDREAVGPAFTASEAVVALTRQDRLGTDNGLGRLHRLSPLYRVREINRMHRLTWLVCTGIYQITPERMT
jgi:hypothetical protein